MKHCSCKRNPRPITMHSDEANQDSPLDGSTPSSLGRLATALGCTVGDFYNRPSADVAQLSEVVRLWGLLRSEDDRARVLRLLRERAMSSQ